MNSLIEQYTKKRSRDDQSKSASTITPITTSTSKIVKSNTIEPPHFLIIGAQKAGTMAAVANLNKHSDIHVLSEIHYFDLGWHQRSISSYRNLFKVTNKTVLGEKTPELIYVDECATRIREVCNPDIKFILYLRDPIKRAYSAWNMNRSKNREEAAFDECVARNMDNLNEYRSYGTAEFHYVQRGFYYEQIERFLEIFPNRNNLLIVIAEQMKKNPEKEYNRMFDFLGVKQEKMDFEDDHIGNYNATMSSAMSEKLRKLYKPHNEKLFEFLGIHLIIYVHLSFCLSSFIAVYRISYT